VRLVSTRLDFPAGFPDRAQEAVPDFALEQQRLAVQDHLVPEGAGREIATDEVLALHGDPLVETQEPDPEMRLRLETEEPLAGHRDDLQVREADFLAVEDDSRP